LEYCKGNLTVFQEFTFIEILEAIKLQAEKENTDILLRVYQASYMALRGVEFEEFKNTALLAAKESTSRPIAEKKSPQEIEAKVEKIISNTKWEAI
jgi:hypothetical protein